jgi:hypothetical protein
MEAQHLALEQEIPIHEQAKVRPFHSSLLFFSLFPHFFYQAEAVEKKANLESDLKSLSAKAEQRVCYVMLCYVMLFYFLFFLYVVIV